MTDHRPTTICEFAFPGPLRDALVGAVLSGRKTATTSLLLEWEHDGDPLPAVGERQTVIDSAGKPVGVIEITACDVIRLGDADDRLAVDEGEDYTTVEGWRAEHERFWLDEVQPDLGIDLALDDDTPIVVERFRLVERLPAP